jgi:hypothetical protein
MNIPATIPTADSGMVDIDAFARMPNWAEEINHGLTPRWRRATDAVETRPRMKRTRLAPVSACRENRWFDTWQDYFKSPAPPPSVYSLYNLERERWRCVPNAVRRSVPVTERAQRLLAAAPNWKNSSVYFAERLPHKPARKRAYRLAHKMVTVSDASIERAREKAANAKRIPTYWWYDYWRPVAAKYEDDRRVGANHYNIARLIRETTARSFEPKLKTALGFLLIDDEALLAPFRCYATDEEINSISAEVEAVIAEAHSRLDIQRWW